MRNPHAECSQSFHCWSATCDAGQHCYCLSRSVQHDAFGLKVTRVRYCCYCAQDRPRRKITC